MADDQISVELIAKIDQLISGLNEARAQITGTTEGIASDVHSMAESVKKEEGLLHDVLSGAAFLEFKEIAKESLEAVKSAFEGTIGKAEEFSLSNAKFAAMMGTSEEEAAGLSAALRGVGSSAQEYESLALRMEMRLKTNEDGFRQMGIATRDANGELLGGKDLIDSAIRTMGEYKSGTDQNAFALEVFGRRAADVYDLMRVTNESVDRQIAIYKEFGVQLSGTGSASVELEERTNDLRTMFEALQLSIGQRLLPIATAALQWMGGPGVQLLEAAGEAVKFLVASFEAAKVGITAAVSVIMAVLATLWESLKRGSDLLYDVFTGQWGKLKEDMGKIGADIADDWKAAFDTITHEAQEGAKVIDDLYGKPKVGDTSNPYKPAGGGAKSFVAPGKGKPDAEAEEEIAAQEKLGLASIAIAEKTSEHLLAMGQESVDAFVAQQQHLEDLKFKIQQEALDKELQVSGKSFLDKEKVLDQMQQLQQEHEGRLLAIQQDAETRRAQLAQKSLGDFVRDSNERLSVAIEGVQRQFDAERIGPMQRAALELQLTETIKGQQLARLDAELQTLTVGTKAYEDVYKQREKIVKDFTKEVEKIQDEERKAVQKDVQTFAAPLAQGFNQAINSMIVSGKSLQDAMKQMGTSILQSFLSMLEQMAEKWLETQITNALVAEASTRTQAATQIPALAAVAAAGAASAVAGIPIVGPGLAAGAAAATYADTIAYEGLAFAAGGMTLDRDQLVFAHKNEMVLPAHLSTGIQQIIAKGQGGGGEVNLHYMPHINAPERATLAQMLESESRTMLAWIAARSRDGSLRKNM